MRSLSLILLISAFGAMLVSVAYAGSRDGRPWALAAYWCGLVVIFVPLAAWVLAPGTPHKGVAIVAQAAFQSFVKWMYSPLMFKFPDELQHRRTAEDILHYHVLFHPSYALPISPRFPGLEEITTGLVALTRLHLFTAGIIVASVSHVTLAAAVFLLMRTVIKDERIAGIATLVFAINPHNPFFNGMFVYEAPALVFMVVALHEASRPTYRVRTELPLVLICLAAVSVTHHVTAAMTILALIVLGVGLSLRRGSRRDGVRLLGFGAIGAAFLAAWVIFVAPITYSYLSGPVGSVLSGFIREGSTTGTNAIGSAVSPVVTALSVLGNLVMGCLVILGFVLTWRRRYSALAQMFAIVGLGFFGVVGIRILASDGAELAGRLFTYEYLFAAVPAAVAVSALWARRRRTGSVVASLAVMAVFFGNAVSGWPAPYEFVPGEFKVDALESGVTPAGVQAARWIGTHVPPGATVACDWTMCSLLGGYGTQRALDNWPDLFYAPRWDAATRRMFSEAGADFIVVDKRLSAQRPAAGYYFHNESPSQMAAVPFPRGPLEKFNGAAGVDRIYDNGDIVIYHVRRADRG